MSEQQTKTGGEALDDSEEAVPEALADAIERNPEAVAEFVDRLGAVNELLDVVSLGEDALDDDMAVSVARTGSTLAESADAVATPGTVQLAEAVGSNGEDLADALETIVELQRTGALDDLVELATVASLATSALDDDMAVSLARTGASLGELADSAAAPETRRGIESLLTALGDAERTDPEPVGAVGLARSIRDPEVKAGLGYLLTVAKAIGARSGESD